jgi:RNA polymerase sigma-70 factor (ECF subfamily)
VTASDGEVVARVLGGDTEAYAILFRRYGRLVHALALARTTRAAAAAEATRRAFEKVYAELDRLPPNTGFRAALLAAVNEACAEHVRDHGKSIQMLRVGAREVKRGAAGLDLRWVFSGMQPGDAALVALEVVSRLPPAYQAPFLLRFLEGMGGPEAAEAAGVEPAEFRTAVDGARRLFERELKHSLEGAAP